ncbi:plasmid mobilization relaxosome protein MobC [Nocardia gipuzkoensis]|nr:plasmid mobilization relaxosome protein MobC [Nocardia gipuzkoensis]MDE1674341.1 plasmid mobilization relaxosome protein MobC [Nocardia gipuzkoensis]
MVKVSAEEKRLIDQLAEDSGVTPARLMREAVLSEKPPVSSEEIRELLHLLFRSQSALGAVGHNLNQMTRAANATGESPPDLATTLAAVRHYAADIGHAIDTIGRWWKHQL